MGVLDPEHGRIGSLRAMSRLVVAKPGRANLRRLGRFVGRRDELQRLRELVAEGTPLITVSGLSGVGKTRFVREALGELVDSWFSAAEVDDVSALIPAVEQRGGELQAIPGPDRQLIVIDSMDDVSVGRAVIAAVDKFDRLQVVVTSQSRLNVSGEVLFRLAPLSYPNPSEFVDVVTAPQWEAIECFTVAARRINPAFRLTPDNVAGVVELVHAAGGLPLAIDLVANWLRLLSVDQLVHHVKSSLEPFGGGAADLPKHQQDLRDSIRASFEALPPADQEVLGALAHLGNVSAQGLSEGIGRPVPLDVLGRLIDRNLIAVTEHKTSNVTMHPTVRRVVAAMSDGAVVEQRFLAWVGGLVATNAPLLTTNRSKQAFTVFDDLVDDVAAALDMLNRQPLIVSTLIADLSNFWWLTRQSRIEHHWVVRALDSFSDHDLLRARLHLGASRALRLLFDAVGGAAHAEHALSCARRAQDACLIVEVVVEVIHNNCVLGDFTSRVDDVAEARALAEANGLHAALAKLCTAESERELDVGEAHTALELLEQGFAYTRPGHDTHLRCTMFLLLSGTRSALTLFDSSLESLDVALAESEALDPRCGMAEAVSMFRGYCLDEMGRMSEAVEALRRAVTGYAGLESPMNLCQAVRTLAETLASLGEATEAKDLFSRALGLNQMSGTPFRTLVCLVAIAISGEGTRPDLGLCAQILRSMEINFPGFLDHQSGVWDTRIAALRIEVGGNSSLSKCDPAPQTIDQLVARTLAHLWSAPPKAPSFGMSSRETEVLRLVALGYTDKEIADDLHIGIRTANSHVSNILRKLGVERRRQAAAWARANLILTHADGGSVHSTAFDVD